MDTCSHCGGEVPPSATFCPSCGRRTDATEPADAPIDVQHAQPRYFGLGPPIFVFAVSVVLFLVGIVLLLAGSVAFGVLALVVALGLLPTFVAGARRWPDSPIARVGVSAADRVRDEAGVAVESISAWSRAGRDVARLRKEQFQLKRERDALIRDLGQSVFDEDGRADELKATARELDERIDRNERALQRAIASARRRTRKGRAAVAPTEVIKTERDAATSVAEEERATEVAPGDGGAADAGDAKRHAVDVDQST